jgi:hypothetical protein
VLRALSISDQELDEERCCLSSLRGRSGRSDTMQGDCSKLDSQIIVYLSQIVNRARHRFRILLIRSFFIDVYGNSRGGDNETNENKRNTRNKTSFSCVSFIFVCFVIPALPSSVRASAKRLKAGSSMAFLGSIRYFPLGIKRF